MLSMDVALHLPDTVAGVTVFSGVLFTESVWKTLVDKHRSLKVLVTHGTQDSILPFEAGRHLQAFLEREKLDNKFVSFVGPHTITQTCISEFQEFLKRNSK
jgi:phospholipase/carboxylesterase